MGRTITEKKTDPHRCFYRNLKNAVHGLFDADGKFLSEEKIALSNYKKMQEQAPEQLKLLKDILDFAFKNGCFTKEVKGYIFYPFEIMQDEYAERFGIKYGTLITQLTRGKERFIRVFGAKCLFELCDGDGTQAFTRRWLSEERLARYRMLLNSKKNTIERLQNNLIVDLSAYAEEETPYMQVNEFNACCQTLWNQVSKVAVQETMRELQQTGFFGYVNHLFKKIYKTEQEQADFDCIVRMIRGESPHCTLNVPKTLESEH